MFETSVQVHEKLEGGCDTAVAGSETTGWNLSPWGEDKKQVLRWELQVLL